MPDPLDMSPEELAQWRAGVVARLHQDAPPPLHPDMEDRRVEPLPNWDSGRLLDPTPLANNIYTSYLPPGGYWLKDLTTPPETDFSKALGSEHQIRKAAIYELLKSLGFTDQEKKDAGYKAPGEE